GSPQARPEEKRRREYTADGTGADRSHRGRQFGQEQAAEKQQGTVLAMQDAVGGHITVPPDLGELQRNNPYQRSSQSQAQINRRLELLEALLGRVKQLQKDRPHRTGDQSKEQKPWQLCQSCKIKGWHRVPGPDA